MFRCSMFRHVSAETPTFFRTFENNLIQLKPIFVVSAFFLFFLHVLVIYIQFASPVIFSLMKADGSGEDFCKIQNCRLKSETCQSIYLL